MEEERRLAEESKEEEDDDYEEEYNEEEEKDSIALGDNRKSEKDHEPAKVRPHFKNMSK